MSLNELSIYNVIKCELQKTNVHILRNPTSLPCGNSACFDCIQKLIQQKNGLLECTLCNEVHNLNTDKSLPRIIPIEKAIDAHVVLLSQHLIDTIKNTYDQIVGKFNDRSETIKSLVKTMRHEIKEKIKNIKEKLDDLGKNLLIQCDKLKHNVNTNILAQEKELRQFETNQFLAEVQEMLHKNAKNTELLRGKMFECESHLKRLDLLKENFAQTIGKLKFVENSTWLPDYTHIGFVDGINESDNNPTIEHISNDDLFIKQISFKFKPYAACDLGNGKIAITAFEKNKLVILDENYSIIKEVKEANGQAFQYPSGICTNNNDLVYVCDQYNHRVVVFDYEFEGVKQIIDINLINPLYVHCYAKDIYILDNSSKTIKVFNDQGEYLNWFSLKNQDGNQLVDPRFHTIDSDCIILNDNYNIIYIYDKFNTIRQTIKAPVNTKIMSFFLIDTHLYTHEILVDEQTVSNYLVCYERRDSSIFSEYELEWERISRREFMHGTLARSFAMTKINGHLALCLYELKKIVFFEL